MAAATPVAHTHAHNATPTPSAHARRRVFKRTRAEAASTGLAVFNAKGPAGTAANVIARDIKAGMVSWFFYARF